MNYKQKLGYMALGAGILALGIIIGQFVTPDIEAQSNGVFDKITCREIEVIDKDGETTILVQDGAVSVHGKNGGIVFISATEHGGIVLVRGNDGGIASMSATEHGGVVDVSGNDSGSTKMGTDEHGGRVDVFNNQGKNRAVMGVNEYGNGVVSTWDKNGYRQ